MSIYSRMRFLWDKDSHRAIQPHPTAREIHHRSTEQHYWQEQLRLTKELNSLTWWLNWITVGGIAATLASLLLLWWTLSATIESSQLDKRAWIGLGEVQILGELTIGKPLGIRAGLRNSGESPAVHAFVYGHLGFLKSEAGDKRFPFSEDPDYASCVGPKPKWSDTLDGTVILPGANAMDLNRQSPAVPEIFIKLVKREKPTEDIRSEALDLSDLETIRTMRTAPNTPPETKNWTMGLYLVGCINYFDTFRNAHRTTFCAQHAYNRSLEKTLPHGAFIACAQGGNDAD